MRFTKLKHEKFDNLPRKCAFYAFFKKCFKKFKIGSKGGGVLTPGPPSGSALVKSRYRFTGVYPPMHVNDTSSQLAKKTCQSRL